MLQVERIRKRHKGNEQAVDMLKVSNMLILPSVLLTVRLVLIW